MLMHTLACNTVAPAMLLGSPQLQVHAHANPHVHKFMGVTSDQVMDSGN
jgi:hypothetical protein